MSDFDKSSTDARMWARECGKKIGMTGNNIDFLHGYFANYWAAVHDPLQKEVDALRVQLRWIPVTERLPDEDIEVLEFGSHSHPVVAYCGAAKWRLAEDGTCITGTTEWLPIPGRTK